MDPGKPGRGPWLAFAPGWGAEGSRVAQMWDGTEVLRRAGATTAIRRDATRSGTMADGWYYEQFENHTRPGMQVRRRLVSEQSEFQKIELFEAERYGRVLAPRGIFALQSESPFLMRGIFLRIQETLRRVFERVDPYFGPAPIYGCGIWSWTCASRGIDPTAIVDARAERIEAQSRYYNRDVHRGAFAVPNDLRG